MNKKATALPSLKKDTKLPVILNHLEFVQQPVHPGKGMSAIELKLPKTAGG